MTLARNASVALITTLAACTASTEAPGDDEPEELDLSLGGKADVDIASLSSGGDLFINSCRPDGASLVCSPWRIRIAPGGHTVTTQLAEVVQPITHVRAVPNLIAIPGLVGSTVDAAHRQIFWHADCDAGYHVTDIDTGVTRSFALDLAGLGIVDDGHGFCLGEWAYDQARQRAIAIGGRQDRGGEAANEKSNIEAVLALDADGGVEVLHDLRGALDPELRFLHEFQTIASLDPDAGELIAPLQLPPTAAESQLVVDLTTGGVAIADGGGARVHRFFDVTTRQQTALDCNIPGFTSTPTGLDAAPRIRLPQPDLDAHGIPTCIPGFVGAGYDPVGTSEVVLMRSATVPADGVFFVGVADMAGDQWLGLIETDATYGALGMTTVADQRLFMSTEFVPAIEGEDGGPRITLAADDERRFLTAVLPPGSYVIATTGVGDADLSVRAGSAPTPDAFDCRPRRPDANETCRVTLTTAAALHVAVRGVTDTSTVRLTAVAE